MKPKHKDNSFRLSPARPLGAIALVALAFAGLFISFDTVRAAPPLPGAIFTTDSTCSGVNLNIYDSKDDVYIDGGPAHPGAASLPDGSYYVQVTNPSGSLVLGTSVGSGNQTPFVVAGGEPQACYQLSAILIKGSDGTPGYDDTDNPGGEYKVWVSTVSTFDNDSSKTDNFKVKKEAEVSTICVSKFYDANANGVDDDGQQIMGWQFKVFAHDNLILTKETPMCVMVDPGDYQVMESTPVELNWVHTTPFDVELTVKADETKNVSFGNLCLGEGNGCPYAYWAKRGQRLETDSDFAALTALNLVNANGSARNFAGTLAENKTALKNWLLSASPSNMAYALSAELVGMDLNVRHNFVSGTALVYAPALSACGTVAGLSTLGFITINDLITAADLSLGAHPSTPANSPDRACQEALKNALADANNNKNFVQDSPCPFTFGN